MNAYRVQFMNPETGRGFIEGFPSARRAKEIVRAYNRLYYDSDRSGIAAKYLGLSGSKTDETFSDLDFKEVAREFYVHG